MIRPANGFRLLLEILEDMHVRYFAGGSVASSIHGVPRATMDVDLVAGIASNRVKELVERLGKEFYADFDAIKESILAKRAFNLIHYASGYKFDVFPLQSDAYAQAEFERRVMVESSLFGEEPLRFPAASAEDIVLSKLVWYRDGGGVSERQWSNVLGVLRVGRQDLDLDYMRKWAVQLGVSDVFERALSQA